MAGLERGAVLVKGFCEYRSEEGGGLDAVLIPLYFPCKRVNYFTKWHFGGASKGNFKNNTRTAGNDFKKVVKEWKWLRHKKRHATTL